MPFRPFRFTDTHKSSSVYPPRHRLMAVRSNGTRCLAMEDAVGDDGDMLSIKHQHALLRLELDQEGIEWLLQHLPATDRATEEIRYAYELAPFKAFERRPR